MSAANSNKKIEKSREEISKNMIELLSDLSEVCRNFGWHKSGLHIFIAAEELQKMFDEKMIEQPMYQIPKKVKNDELISF